MKRRTITIISLLAVIIVGTVLFRFLHLEFAFVPGNEVRVNDKDQGGLFGGQANEANEGQEQIELGREMFYAETFGNEVFFTDIMGLFDGPFTLINIGKAVLQLNGEGTSNLQVEAAEDFQAGDITIKKGELINTGLDVARGGQTPIGVKFLVSEGRLKAGISCAICHASVDDRGNVISGIPNNDLNVGLTLAMATNTASYFTHGQLDSLEEFVSEHHLVKVETDKGKKERLPDPDLLEAYIDEELVKWPIGTNDPTINEDNNAVKFPHVFTKGNHPYGWSGQGLIGPFNGLSAALNNAHGQNMDATSQAPKSKEVLDIHEEVYLGTVLQRSQTPKYRWDPNRGEKPSEFFKRVDPTPGAPGVIELIPTPNFPKMSFLSTVGAFTSSPGYKAWEQVNAMAAFMNSLEPPKTGLKKDPEVYAEGERVFEQAGCTSCHGGRYFTNNTLIPVEEIGTNPARAKAFRQAENYFDKDAKMYAKDTPVPLPDKPKVIDVEMSKEEQEQLEMGWAQEGSNGGYKTMSLFGLYWTAPYLHDGGVAVGKKEEIGVPNTLLKGIKADPVESLRALIDSKLRQQVIAANETNEKLRTANVTGRGHEKWVDESTGFTKEQQDALIHYLLQITDQ
jgi:cytochrome c peroxidase